MCFIAEANDVASFIDKSDGVILPVAELLDSADEETTAVSQTKFFTQLFTAWHNRNLAQAQKLSTLGKEFCALLLKVFTVNNHQYRR